jgi:hypothetical protein
MGQMSLSHINISAASIDAIAATTTSEAKTFQTVAVVLVPPTLLVEYISHLYSSR